MVRNPLFWSYASISLSGASLSGAWWDADAQANLSLVNNTAAKLENNLWYINRSPSDHQNDIETLPPSGYRLISLQMNGAVCPPDTYNTVWTKSPGPLQQTTSALASTAFDDWFFFWTDLGWVPTIMTAAGAPGLPPPGDISCYAAVLEKKAVGQFSLHRDLTFDALVSLDSQQAADGLKMVHVSQYGDPFIPGTLFSAIWHENPNFDKYAWFGNYVPNVSADPKLPQLRRLEWRPSVLAMSSIIPGKLSSLWVEDYVGRFSSVQNVGATELASLDSTMAAEGLRMIYVSGRYQQWNAIWAEQDIPSSRSRHATGTTRGFRDNAVAQARIDDLVQTFMQRQGIRHAQLAVGKSGNILLERAYSWTEDGRYQAKTDDMMLTASISKMFCAAAIHTLIHAGQLTLTTRPWNDFRHYGYPWLGNPTGPGPNDVRLRFITIQQLLDHQGGWDRTKSGDYIFQMIQVSQSLASPYPPTISEFVDWITRTKMLDFRPGSGSSYSNVGYLVLSKVVEQVTAMAYFDYLNSAVLAPLGLSNAVKVYSTSWLTHQSDGLAQDTVFDGPDVTVPRDSEARTPNVFGGDGMYKETAVGPSSLAMSASTIVKFISKQAVWGHGPRCNKDASFPVNGPPFGDGHPCYRDGVMDGARAWAESRTDGLDWSVVLNTRDFKGPSGDLAFRNFLVGGISAFLDEHPLA